LSLLIYGPGNTSEVNKFLKGKLKQLPVKGNRNTMPKAW